MNGDFELQVSWERGCHGDEEPCRFWLGAREVEVIEVLDLWPSEEYRYFKLRGDDDGVYILRHDHRTDRWELTLFDSGKRDDTRLSST